MKNWLFNEFKSSGFGVNLGCGRKKANSFNFALCLNVLEHVYKYQQLTQEIHRVLKPGGRSIYQYHLCTENMMILMISSDIQMSL
jgi:2-polyprenyl-3-methyl-5-hydroxy-6-metoxy-1,4-benzoquinol methylase